MTSIRPTGLFLLFLLWASSSAASPILNSSITGADMAGIEVTAFFGGGSESALWAVTSAGPGGPFGEGFAGAASGTAWTLSQQGYSLGNVDPQVGVLGLWTLTNNTGFNITRLQIDALIANIVFDVIASPEVTPGSGPGRAFTPDPAYTGFTNATYSNQLSLAYNDLFGTLTIDFGNGLAAGASLQFLADTDLADTTTAIPAPGSLWLFALGLFAMCFRKFGFR